jgi:(4-alkanoyl-5-oxo-2,5-dihydrofuran-3-yl)methyl phosphate reductase
MILVTGASGNVGREIADQLLAQGRKVRVFTRDAAKVAQFGGRAEIALGDFTQPDTFAAAAGGAEAVFLMNGALDDGVFRRLIDLARGQGVRRAVFLSSLYAAEPGSPIGRLHKAKEDTLIESGLEAAIIRAGGFMSNTNQWVGSIKAEGVIYNPMGNAPVALTHPADIAAVAVHALTIPKLTETVLDVTGDTALMIEEQIAILAKVLGRPLQVVDVAPEVAVQGLIKNGVPVHVAQALGASYAAGHRGSAATVTDTVKRVTGRKPRSYESWVREHAARFA